MRIRDVTTIPTGPCTGASFLASCAEPPGEDGPHVSIDMHFIAITPGARLLANTDGTTTLVEAGTTTTQTQQHNCPVASGCGTEGWDSVAFSTTFPNAPAVLAQIQSVANETSIVDPTAVNPPPSITWLTSAVQSVSTTGFELALERSEADVGAISSDETIAWLAIEQTGGCRSLDLGGGASVMFEAAATPTQIDGWDDGCNAVPEGYAFDCAFSSSPLVVATKRTHNGGDGGWLRRCLLDSNQVVFTVDEDQTQDGERSHIDEAASIVAFANDFVCFAATQALVASLHAFQAPVGVEVEWNTAAEASTLAFVLERFDSRTDTFLPVREPVLALLDRPQGGIYRVADPGAAQTGNLIYRLIELEPSGTRRYHGPFTVEVESSGGSRLEDKTFMRHAHQQEHNGSASLPTKDGASGSAGAEGVEAAKIAVRSAGLVRVTTADIANALGLSLAETARRIELHRFALSQGGGPVAWRSTVDGQAIEFYGQSIDSPYTRDNIYRLRPGAGLRMRLRSTGSSTAITQSFTETLHIEQDARPVTLLPLDPEGDTWFWDFVQAGQAAKDFSFEAPGVSDTEGTATLTLHLQGGSESSHELEVELNGFLVSLPGEVVVESVRAASVPLTFSQSLLVDGPNLLTIRGIAGDLVFIDSFEVVYQRLYRAESNRLLHRVEEPSRVTVTGFQAAGIRVFDLTNPHRPRLLTGTSETFDPANGYQVSYSSRGRDRTYLAIGPEGHVPAEAVVPDRDSNLLSSTHAASYLVITTAALEDAAAELVELRLAQGLSAMVVDIEDIYDELNHGIADPHAIRDLLAWAAEHWLEPPVYVALAGAGTYDFRDLLGLGGNLIPPLLARSSFSIFATDTPLADLDGDGTADFAVGRIPVTTAAELTTYAEKVAAYESFAGQDDLNAEVVLLADDPDAGGRFPEDSDTLAAQLDPGVPRQAIYLSRTSLPEARQQLFDAFARDPFMVNYYGHGGVDRMASEGLITNADVSALGGSGRTIVSAVSCHIGLFAIPGFDSLGEHLVRQPAGGAIAVVAPVWLSHHGQAQELGTELFNQLLPTVPITEDEGAMTLGDAFQSAIEGFAAAGASPPLVRTYNLLGDPALRLPR
ncbi:MAG: C25 family cysteine peptidase [Acidobacteriota bacterium]